MVSEKIAREDLDKLAEDVHKVVTSFMEKTGHSVKPRIEVDFTTANTIGKKQYVTHVLITAELQSAI